MQNHITSLHDSSEYSLSEQHKNIRSSFGEQEQVEVKNQTFNIKHKGKNVNVTIEFPTTPNEKAEEEFNKLLKSLYLKKIEIGSMQNGETALSCLKLKRTEDKNHE